MAGNTKSPVINAYWMDRRIEGVLSVEVEDHDQLIDKATIVLEDGGRLAPTACYPEEKVVIEMGWDGHTAVLFEGLVVEGGGEHVQSGSQAKMVAYDYSVRMHRTRVNHKIAKGAKLSAVVKEIASKPEYKFKAEDIHIDLDDDPEFKRDMSEPNTTDLQFLQKLALQFQCRTFVEYNAPKGGSGDTSGAPKGHSQFYFKSLSKILQGDVAGTLYFCPGVHQLVDFHYQRVASAGDAEKHVDTLSDETGKPVSQAAEPTPPEKGLNIPDDVDRDLAGVTSKANAAAEAVVSEASAAAGKPHDGVTKTGVAGAPSDEDNASRAVKRDPTRVMGVVGEGTSTGNINIRAKSRISLVGISPWYEGDWYLKVVRHRYERMGKTVSYMTRFLATR